MSTIIFSKKKWNSGFFFGKSSWKKKHWGKKNIEYIEFHFFLWKIIVQKSRNSLRSALEFKEFPRFGSRRTSNEPPVPRTSPTPDWIFAKNGVLPQKLINNTLWEIFPVTRIRHDAMRQWKSSAASKLFCSQSDNAWNEIYINNTTKLCTTAPKFLFKSGSRGESRNSAFLNHIIKKDFWRKSSMPNKEKN